MAFTEIYVDPSIAGDSGTGTIGDPYGDLEYAIEQETFDTTNGTRVNIKAGTSEVLAAELDAALANTVTTVAWTPTEAAPLVFQGYTAAAGDGGIGVISGNDTVEIISTARSYIYFIDLKLTNGATDAFMTATGNYCAYINVEFQCGGASYGPSVAAYSPIIGCYINEAKLQGIRLNGPGTHCIGNVVIPTVSTAVGIASLSANFIERNIVICDTDTGGISLSGVPSVCNNNSVYAAAGTKSGIQVFTNTVQQSILNNLIEGFSGTGGMGIEIQSGGGVIAYGGNSVYNCATAFSDSGLGWNPGYAYDSNETLSASPFADASNGDFSPVDTGAVKEGSFPATFPTF